MIRTGLRAGIGFALLLAAAAPSAQALSDAQVEASAQDRALFSAIIERARAGSEAAPAYSAVIQRIVRDAALQGRDYEHAPLDGDPAHERLQAGFGRFDCVTYVETVLALASTAVTAHPAFARYADALAALRYRDGEPAYCARLHYFTDWVRAGVAAGRLEDVTVRVADAPDNLAFADLPNGLDYLSRHAASLPALASSAERRACVQAQEQALTAGFARSPAGVPGFAYIPRSRVPDVLDRLHGGDVVAWVAEQPGLDVIHVGIVLRDGSAAPGLAHASSRNGEVSITPDLRAYARQLPRQRGLLVLRPMPPR